MWEIEILASRCETLEMSLYNAIMSIWHPTNPKFALFHSLNKLWLEVCHILMVWKLAELYAHDISLCYSHICNGNSPKRKVTRWFLWLQNGLNQWLGHVPQMHIGTHTTSVSKTPAINVGNGYNEYQWSVLGGGPHISITQMQMSANQWQICGWLGLNG